MHIKTFISAAALTAAVFCAGQADAGTWRRIESPHFVIYTDASEKIGRDYIGKLEAYDFAADKLFGEIGDSQVDDTHKYNFYLLNDIAEYRTVRPKMASNVMNSELSSSAYGSQFFSSRSLNDDRGDRRINDADLAYLLRSYTGIKIHQFFSNPLPDWVVGGLEDYFMMTHVEGKQVLVGLPMPSLVVDENIQFDRSATTNGQPTPVTSIIPLKNLINGDYKDKDGGRLARYEQWILINYFMTDGVARGRFLTYLTRSQMGLDKWQTFTSTTGLTEDGFRALYVEYSTKSSPFLTYPLEVDVNAHIKVDTLPAYGADVPLFQAAVVDASDDYGKTLLTRMRPIVASNPDDDLALRTMAMAEMEHGDPHNAAPYIDKLISRDPKAAESLYLKGRMFSLIAAKESGDAADKDYASARDMLGQAYQLDPSNPHILAAFAEAHSNLKDYPDTNTQQALELAQSYSGGAYGLLSAEYAVRADHPDRALNLLQDWPENITDPSRKAAMQKIVDTLKANGPKDETLHLIKAYRDMPVGDSK